MVYCRYHKKRPFYSVPRDFSSNFHSLLFHILTYSEKEFQITQIHKSVTAVDGVNIGSFHHVICVLQLNFVQKTYLHIVPDI